MRALLLCFFLGCLGCGVDADNEVEQPAGALRVLIQPLGEVDPAHVDSISIALSREHMVIPTVAPSIGLPASAYTTVRSPRYRADTLIAWLRAIKPDSVDLIVGITAQDISITKYGAAGNIKEPADKYRDFGVFGLGFIGGPSCVVSTFRLGDRNSQRLFDRLMKIAVHEVGHNRSLPHCTDPTCVMRDAVERIATIDAAERSFCAACKAQLARTPR